MPRLVIVSNRVSLPSERTARAGGLALAMRDALQHYGGVWFGWSGDIAESSSTAPHVASAGGVTYVTVDLSRADHQGYYVDYANGSLWPLLHYRLGLVDYKRRDSGVVTAREASSANRSVAMLMGKAATRDCMP